MGTDGYTTDDDDDEDSSSSDGKKDDKNEVENFDVSKNLCVHKCIKGSLAGPSSDTRNEVVFPHYVQIIFCLSNVKHLARIFTVTPPNPPRTTLFPARELVIFHEAGIEHPSPRRV